MDPILIATYTEMLATHHCTVDDILEDPILRNSFVATVRQTHPTADERTILHRLTTSANAANSPKANPPPTPPNPTRGV